MRSILIACAIVLLLLVVAAFVRRREHPGGTVLMPERTVVTEHWILGLFQTEADSRTHELHLPVVLRDGAVVHTLPRPSKDPATLGALQSLRAVRTSGA